MTTLLLLRHAAAEDRESAAAAGTPDALRPLTPKGKRRMREVAASLARQVPDLAHVATSPLLRAVQTAEILAAAYAALPLTTTEALAPGAPPKALLAFIEQQRVDGPCALVGHEPDLGRWASWALCGGGRPFMPFKKAGAALLTFPGPIQPGQGELAWFLEPGQLRLKS